MIKFCIQYSDYDVTAEIRSVVVDRETEKSVWINGARSAKRSEWNNYFDTFIEAKEHLEKWQNIRINTLRNQLSNAEKRLLDIELLKEI